MSNMDYAICKRKSKGEITMSYFSKALEKLMKERGLNQTQIADILGVRQSQISNWLNGKSQPTYGSIDLLRKKMKIEVASLFE